MISRIIKGKIQHDELYIIYKIKLSYFSKSKRIIYKVAILI